MINLITTDSYYNMFSLLLSSLEEKGKNIEQKNIIFCEEKISLMIERFICEKFSGTFNAEVYSFGNFLRAKKPMDNLLSLEGSAMAVKKILSSVNLNCFKASKRTLAPTLYNLIIQLKSAKVTPKDLKLAIEKTDGILKNKLIDIFNIFDEYEKFISENNFEDQSSYLSYLPEEILNSEYLTGANIYIVGFSGLTEQMRSAIIALINKTNNLTAILCEGENPLVFVNESCEFIKKISAEYNYPILFKHKKSDYNECAKKILENIFNPFFSSTSKTIQSENDGVYFSVMPSATKEVERVGQIIKQKVINGECRYKDITIAIPKSSYNGYIENVFADLEIPYFIDERKKVEHHPLVKLILSYIDTFRKNFERKTLVSFVKNPYFCQDKNLVDKFENYLLKYNVNYLKIKQPFTLRDKEDLDILNELRQKVVKTFENFDVLSMLESLSVKEKGEEFSIMLSQLNEFEQSAINEQMYDAIINLLQQMKLLLDGLELSLNEYKNIFISGVSALEMSIIPQYNDAVFIGDYKQTALAKANYLFALGLTSEVPGVQADVSLLSDDDICALEDIKVLVEPKIKVVNHRIRENVALSICAFNKCLYLSYPACEIDGTKNVRSEIIDVVEKIIETKPFPADNGYLTKRQGLKTFSKECGEFSDGKTLDLINASSFYKAVDDEIAKDIIERANKEIKERLLSKKEILIKNEIAPTTIEEYYTCPYKSFMSRVIRLRKRENGSVDNLSVGNIMHNIFNEYVKNIEKVKDEKSSNEIFESVKDKVLEKERYKKFLLESSNAMTLKRILSECKKYCFKTYLSIKNSNFSSYKTEVKFGEKGEYPAISLSNGSVKIKGMIDRVDESEKYFRVIDYKTGKTDSTDKSIFAGVKLQLLLYGVAVSNKYKNGEKTPAGLYYLPISDKYSKEEKSEPMADGHTISEENAILEQEQDFFSNRSTQFMPIKLDDNGKVKNAISSGELKGYIDYALSVSELAVEQLKDGVIVASPYSNACSYCEYKGFCNSDSQLIRQLESVKGETIIDASEGGKQNG